MKRVKRRHLRVGAKQALEIGPGVHCRRVCVGVELKHPKQPGAQLGRRRLKTSPHALGQIRDSIGIFLFVDGTTEQQFQRDDANLHRVGALIERRRRARRQRNSQIFPIAVR